jgi:uncharacterized protein
MSTSEGAFRGEGGDAAGMTVDAARRSRRLVHALGRRLGAAIVETHISWVLLTPDTAYKIKKPVRTPFLDYSTLERRRMCCEEEIRINSRWAPGIYIDVQSITGSWRAPVLGSKQPSLEYAVRMRRFDESDLFAQRLAAGSLRAEQVDGMAALLARLHETALVAPVTEGFGSPELRRQLASGALAGAKAAASPTVFRSLTDWLEEEALRLDSSWRRRLELGRVRECHGDLHLANLIWTEAGAAAFDAVEFDPRLRWIDVADDIAFPVMDFSRYGRRDFAYRLLCSWLDRTGDHDALSMLRFSAVYRALVRCSVALMPGGQHKHAEQYLDCALEWTRPRPPQLTIMHGLPGSGKTTVSQALLEGQGVIRVRSDVERKRLWGLGMLESSQRAGLDIYSQQATERTYQRLFELAANALAAGFPVVIDAAFLKVRERQDAQALAARFGARFTIAACEAPQTVLEARLRARHGDASEADIAVLRRVQTVSEPLLPSESRFVQHFAEPPNEG